MMFAAILVCLSQGVKGIGAGEQLVKRAESAPPSEGQAHFGRVLDALTGRPLEGVRVEAWTEDWEQPALLVDEARTRADGSFWVEAAKQQRATDKLRFSLAGYRSTTRAPSDLGENILLAPGKAPASVVLADLRGRPIPGARVTTRQTCAHGPSAIEVFSDAEGRVDLSSMPPLDDEPELEVTVDGFEALRNREPEDAFEVAGETTKWLLGAKRPVRFRLLDSDGESASNTRVLMGFAPEWSSTTTDADGRAAFLFGFQYENSLLHALQPGRDGTLIDFPGWNCGELVLRLNGDPTSRRARGDDPEVTLEPAQAGLPFVLLHEHGWRRQEEGLCRFPPGKAQLLVGGPFSGFVEHAQTHVLEPGAKVHLVVDAEPEPEFEIDAVLGPDGEPLWVEIVLEAAGHSVRFGHRERATYSAPPGVPVTLALPSVRRPFSIEFDPQRLEQPLAIHELEEWKSQPKSPELETLAIEVPPELTALLRVRAQARGTLGSNSEPGKEGWPIRIERGAAVELSMRAEGYVSRKLVLPASEPRPRIVANLVRCARVEVRGKKLRALIGPQGAAEHDEAGVFALEDLAPGPLELALDIDGTWHTLRLNLAPGANRKLALQ